MKNFYKILENGLELYNLKKATKDSEIGSCCRSKQNCT